MGGTPCSEHSISWSTSSNVNGSESDLGGNGGYGGICGLPRQVRDSKPERTRNLEPGTKWSLPDDKLLLTAAAFQVTKDDVMENVGDDYETLGTLDTGENRVRGLEFSVVGNVTDDLSFVVAAAMAADALEAGFVASTLSSVSLEAIAAELHGPKWFQLYCQPTRERTLALVRRAEAAGFRESINSEHGTFRRRSSRGEAVAEFSLPTPLMRYGVSRSRRCGSPSPGEAASVPVWPNPPRRDVASSPSVSAQRTCATGATTSWAIRVPRVIVTGSAPRLTTNTWTSSR